MSYATFPLTPQFALREETRYNTLVSPDGSTDIQIRKKWDNPLRKWTLNWEYATKAEAQLLRAFARDMRGPGMPFYYNISDTVARPWAAPVLGTSDGGSLGNRTRYASFAWQTDYGKTVQGVNVAGLSLSNGHVLTVTVPTFPTNVISAEVYVGPTMEDLYTQSDLITTSAGTWTEPTTGYVDDQGSPATTNTATEIALARLADEEIVVAKISGVWYSMSVVLEEVRQP